MPYSARKFSSETHVRLLSQPDARSPANDDLPPRLHQQSPRLVSRAEEPDDESLSLKEPFFYACLLATIVFVFFSTY